MEMIITSDIKQVKKFIKKSKKPIVCDIETTAITVGKGKILCIGMSEYGSQDILVYWPKDLKDLARVTINKAVFHNATFDMRWLKSYGMEVNTVWDTMLMAHLINENETVGLDDLGERLLGFGKEKIDIENLETLPKEEVSIYVAKDIHITKELLKWQRNHIKNNLKPGERPYSVMKNILLPAIEPLTQMEDNKLPLILSEVTKVRSEVESKLHEIDRELDSSIPPKEEWPEYLQKTTPKWGVTNWTRWWLYVYQGAECPTFGKPSKQFPEGNPSLSQATLGTISHPAAKLLSDRSTLNKLLTGFLIPLEQRGSSGRVPTSFKLHGTVTGRLSSASPAKDNPGINSQQIPRDPKIRNLFGEEGHVWIEADYSQLELRVAAVMSGDRTMQDLFTTGEDIHTYMAKKLVKQDEVTSLHRTLAKGVNFGFLYGMHSKHFANYLKETYGVTISPEDAEIFREDFFNTFQGLQPWYKKQKSVALKYGGVPNAFGRFRHLPKVYSDDYWVQEAAFRQAINSPVQSTGSDFMLLSLAKLARDLRLRSLGAKLITTVHDSVCLTAPEESSEEVAHILKNTMEGADKGLRQEFFLTADVTVSDVWGGKEIAEY